MTTTGSVSIVRRFNSPKIQLKLKLALTLTDTGGGVLTLTDTGDLRTIEPSDYRADTQLLTISVVVVVFVVKFIYSLAQLRFWHIKLSFFWFLSGWVINNKITHYIYLFTRNLLLNCIFVEKSNASHICFIFYFTIINF